MPHIVLSELSGQRVPVFVEFDEGAVRSGERAELQAWARGKLANTIEMPLLAQIRH